MDSILICVAADIFRSGRPLRNGNGEAFGKKALKLLSNLRLQLLCCRGILLANLENVSRNANLLLDSTHTRISSGSRNRRSMIPGVFDFGILDMQPGINVQWTLLPFLVETTRPYSEARPSRSNML